MNQSFKLIILSVFLFVFMSCNQKGKVIVVSQQESPREKYAVEKLVTALTNEGYQVEVSTKLSENTGENQIVLSTIGNEAAEASVEELPKEGFVLKSNGKIISVTGADASGELYGCLELADRITKEGKLPKKIDVTDAPEMVLRGTCVGLQKTDYLPGRHVYEYPYTPENFPWFYDKEQWINYLDMLVENRYNSLYLWNGHPFASLVKLDDYPFAVEVDDKTFLLNEEMFAFLTEEANKRGIWVIQMFYNIIVSKPFAEHYNIKTQERSRPIIPVIADYTQKSIAEFVKKYPNVGLMVCLGEAMHTIDDDVAWFTKTIIPGVHDGMAALGITEEPPIVLRGHDTDAEQVMKAALPIYKNLYTTYKYNGESLTTYEPRNMWSEVPTALSELGSVHISNVHILANLEPFRYGSPDFIQKSVKAMHELQGANGIHIYPQSSYWDWPYTADKTEPRTKQIDRDKLWYAAWARYAWKVDRDEKAEDSYWSGILADTYGCDKESGALIQKAYEEFGEIAPKLLRTFGISDGNRQTLLLGNFMSQLVNPRKWTLYESFVESNGPESELLIDYVKKDVNGEKHVGETPPQIISEVVKHGEEALAAIGQVAGKTTKNTDEFNRLCNDVKCYNQIALFFAAKVKAADFVLRYKYSNNLSDLEKALPFLEESVEQYRILTDLTNDTYLYANSMQTQQRRVPIAGTNRTNKHWSELLPQYEDELENFKRNIEKMKANGGAQNTEAIEAYLPADVKILNKNVSRYPLKSGSKVNTDRDYKIIEVADELKNLVGVSFAEDEQRGEGTSLQFECKKAVKVVVGHFNGNSLTILPPPTLETNALANERGQADIRVANAMTIDGLYPVNVYTYLYEAGSHELLLNKGRVLILGFIDGKVEIETHDAGITTSEDGVPIDWLFY
ncbi:hypothetical protein [uncultured Draconibacterium sp.]|uniref:alpha-d-galacturonidase n=1 Tax=uncultured Draconibacterium sp. TaxID=1573823 RepID=UPI00321678BD